MSHSSPINVNEGTFQALRNSQHILSVVITGKLVSLFQQCAFIFTIGIAKANVYKLTMPVKLYLQLYSVDSELNLVTLCKTSGK